jgi:biopolymer transport protein ExbD
MNFRGDSDRKKPLAVFSQSSLTDIVLLLLVFFLLTSSFVSNFGIKVNVPKAETGDPNVSQQLVVSVTKDKEFYVSGELVARASLAAAIREEYQKNPNRTLVLRADKDARVDDAVQVMNIAQALNLKIVMATERANR